VCSGITQDTVGERCGSLSQHYWLLIRLGQNPGIATDGCGPHTKSEADGHWAAGECSQSSTNSASPMAPTHRQVKPLRLKYSRPTRSYIHGPQPPCQHRRSHILAVTNTAQAGERTPHRRHWGLNGEEGSHDNAFRTTAIVLDRSQILSPRGCKVDNEVLPASDIHHHSNLKVPYRKVRNHISCPLFHSSDFTSASSIVRRVCRTSLRC